MGQILLSLNLEH